MSLFGEIWSCGSILAAGDYASSQARRRADAQILPDKLFAAKPRKTQFTAVLILR